MTQFKIYVLATTAFLLMVTNLTIAAVTAPQVSPIVTTNAGRVQGMVDMGVSAYKGIPYAAPPTGSLRFKPPKPAPAWSEILDASGYGAPAMQLYNRHLTGSDISMQLGLVLNTRGETKIDNEDSLFLNIWTPQSNKQAMGKQRPVIVWIHGGGYAYGSGSWQVYDGKALPKHPFTPNAPEATSDIPILIGWNKDESTIFNTIAPWFGKLSGAELKSRMVEAVGEQADELINAYQQRSPEYSPTYVYNAYLGDTFFFAPSIVLAERRLAQPDAAPIYIYNLAWETPVAGGLFKATHTLDLPLVFNNVDLAVALTGDSPEARKLEHQMSSAWIAFARNGNPNIDDLPQWPRYDLSKRPTMIFDANSHIVNDLNPKIREVLTAKYR